MEPTAVAPHIWEAHAGVISTSQGFESDPTSTLGAALAAIEKAIALDSASGGAHSAKGFVLLLLARYDAAEQEILLSLELDPILPDTHLALTPERSFSSGPPASEAQEFWRRSPARTTPTPGSNGGAST